MATPTDANPNLLTVIAYMKTAAVDPGPLLGAVGAAVRCRFRFCIGR